jgi:hypothetical protein
MQAQYGTPQTGKRLATPESLYCVGRSCISWQLVPVPDGLGEERISEGLTARSFLIKAIFASSPAVVGLDIPTNRKKIGNLEKVQKRAARFVFNNYTDRTSGCVTKMVESCCCQDAP